MNKKIFLSSASILAALVLMSGATFAFFSDVGSSSDNVFASGTIDLKLGNGVAAASDSVTGTFGQSNMIPGGTATTATLNLRNTGSIVANHVDITVTDVITQSGSSPGNASTNPMDRYLRLTALTYDLANILTSIADSNLNGFKDLEDLKNNNLTAGDLQNLALSDIGVDHPLTMSVQLDISAPNDVQGDSVNVTFVTTLDQGPTH